MEICDLYDVNRVPLGRTAVRGERLNEGEHINAVHICIFSSDGKMLIQKRSPQKRAYPGTWDVSCGGCEISGESSSEAIKRELREELGITLREELLRPRITVNFSHGFDDFYCAVEDIDIASLTLQTEEVQEIRWASMDEVCTLLESGEFIPYFASMLRLLFDMRNKLDGLNL